MISEPESLISDFIRISAISGLDIDRSEVQHECLFAPHKPSSLPSGKQAVYVFSLSSPNHSVLKVGQAGPKSNARFQSQHYDPQRAKSTLAAALLKNKSSLGFLIETELTDENVGSWIRTNTDRDHFLLDEAWSKVTLSLLEVFLQAKLRPMFEG